METFVLYLYRTMGEIESYNDDKIISTPSIPLVALLDSNDPAELTRGQKIDKYNLRPFELQQNLIDRSIKLFPKNNVKILNIEFDFTINDQLKEELDEAIRFNDYYKIDNIITEARQEGFDILSIVFLYKSREFRVTKYGLVEINGHLEELASLTYNSPVALLMGTKRDLESQEI